MKPSQSSVREFLSTREFSLFIDGAWQPAANRRALPIHDPGDGEVIGALAAGDALDIDEAVAAGQRAFVKSGWATMPANDRAVILHRWADLAERHTAALAEIEALDVGKSRKAAASVDVPQFPKTLRYYADLAVTTRRREPLPVSGYEARQIRVPYGVCGFIIPWNFPLLLIAWSVAPALAAGNTVVIKPPEDASLSALYLCHLATEAGVPNGVFNVVTGLGETAGAALARHPGIKRMSFTGSPEVGRSVAEACGRNLIPVKLELGGKGAAVLFDDVDVEQVAQSLAGAITFNTGQVCCTATRWLVQENIYRPFVDAVTRRLQSVAIGHGLDDATEMGPLISEKQRQRVLGYLERGEREGARVLLRGGATTVGSHTGGYYVKPALLEGSPDNICAREEIFGPVAFLLPFKSEDDGVDLANRSPYGLGNSVWTQNLDRANRVAEALIAGTSWINCHNVMTQGVPYGGYNLSGLGGGVLGIDSYLDYLRPQSIVRPTS